LGQRPGPGKAGQNNTKTSLLMKLPPENLKSITKNVFFVSTRIFGASVEDFNSSPALAAGDLWPKKDASICWRVRSNIISWFPQIALQSRQNVDW